MSGGCTVDPLTKIYLDHCILQIMTQKYSSVIQSPPVYSRRNGRGLCGTNHSYGVIFFLFNLDLTWLRIGLVFGCFVETLISWYDFHILYVFQNLFIQLVQSISIPWCNPPRNRFRIIYRNKHVFCLINILLRYKRFIISICIISVVKCLEKSKPWKF